MKYVILKRISKFFSIGLLATFIHISVYSCALSFELASAQKANFVGFVIAFIFSFVGQTFITFELKKSEFTATVFIKFCSIAILGYLINAFWVYCIKEVLSLNPQWAVVAIAVLTPAVTFLFLSKWVYKEATVND
ncbi:GtrA family protein [Psychrosphaera aestuarii]|uniref:GtrA family protein n=1 Tax=Psychrosphaera aestuarii TaxID=1266052 RepID=UPI001B342EC5|nr:GtrA family protein [Psychrosphaera aestuarii]